MSVNIINNRKLNKTAGKFSKPPGGITEEYLSEGITQKFSKQVPNVTCSGSTVTVTNSTYIGTDYLLEEYVDNPNAYIKSRSISGNTLIVEFSDTITEAVILARRKES